MRVPSGPAGSHLTYCTNVHAGESWTEVRANLERYVVPVRNRVAPDRRFGVGLRLSARATEELLASSDALAELRRFLEEHALYVFTINGFPYGAFHATRVKEAVYRPDWLEESRLAYTNRLADVLASLLPRDGDLYGSISTVPLGDRVRVASSSAFVAAVEHIARHVVHVARIHETTGKLVVLALEPEPCCALETSAETAAFFRTRVFTGTTGRRVAELLGTGEDAGEDALHRHLGVCLDACHAAVQFESASHAVTTLQAAGLRIAKLQLSAGLRVQDPDAAARERLRAFADDVYLHQVVIRRSDASGILPPGDDTTGANRKRPAAACRHDRLERYLDLPDALASPVPADDVPGEEWRIHVHVPLFQEQLGDFPSTQPFVRDLLALQRRDGLSSHLEIETYTWDVLPSAHRGADVVEDITREFAWVLDHLHA